MVLDTHSNVLTDASVAEREGDACLSIVLVAHSLIAARNSQILILDLTIRFSRLILTLQTDRMRTVCLRFTEIEFRHSEPRDPLLRCRHGYRFVRSAHSAIRFLPRLYSVTTRLMPTFWERYVLHSSHLPCYICHSVRRMRQQPAHKICRHC